ncbi:dimethyl sulfoxide reductase anchor subunit family protein [Solemya velum gill symbiont]|uniref:DMSO reductase n=1 Tax=Solemya velum gill symbiont TaxID=2340 RepID=A0A1T2KP38_SOVGS|nr:DmsC/YnfH family molybdoenzyme membrane anchor subunit [Solemya velum gill symbiont]OOY35212.1 DMSO reductase [Solemya velum gill symbiont]OOY37913.1 DMSO reductase [Solemya velum gill symbiont]OOY39623.1 DMSO reductase [Solemya velum gill symbiont]OOY43488.1 DMSO reductase [Solemya velum gill symbiont]OOY48281.1 DMSO reductase [Solemya velum gill symbiont]
MHPAFSVIFLTTLLGVAQGLFLALVTGQYYSLANLIPAQDSATFYGMGSFLVLVFLGLGLFSSFFHLGRPERAWRSATMWRTSWLSREVIALPVFMCLVFLYGLAHYMQWNEPMFTIGDDVGIDLTIIIGLFASIAAFVLFICTAMIYASVRFMQEWHHWLTVANYIFLGLTSGFTLAAAFTAWRGIELVNFFGFWAAFFLVAGLVTRGWSLYRNVTLKHKSTSSTAIGVRHNAVVQKSQGSMGGNFNTREFFHGQSEAVLKLVRYTFLVLVFAVPAVLLAAAWATASPYLPMIAFAIQYLGLLFERWYFFAEAKHPQNLYYQSIA